VDVIEVFNARTSQNKNAKALALAKEYGKPGIAASDAHFLQEIGLTRMSFDTSKCHSERQRKISRGACPDNYEILHFVQNDRGESQSETSQSETSQSETSQGETSLKSAILNSEGRIIRAEESPLFYSTFTGLVKFYKTKDPHIPLAWIKKLRSLLVDREL